MKRSLFLASGVALALLPRGIARSATAQALVRVFDGKAVASIPLDQYLYGVVAREMPPSWPAAALEAQAICARTYVLQRTNPEKPYDVVNSEGNQVYGEIEAASPAANAAVDATTGKILRFGPAIASVAYSSCCGGRTESSADAWGTVDVPYLRSTICPWCVLSPDYRWMRMVDAEDVTRAFAPGIVQNITVGTTDASGRARDIILSGTTGSTHVPANVFRERIGTRIIRSLFLQRIAASQEAFAIYGAGYGHGVGLCQWGAKGMADAAHSTEDILNFYFPGTELSQS